MTTIACSSKLLLMVADSAASIGERIERTHSKLYRYRDFIAGFSGSHPDIARFREWLRTGKPNKAPRGEYEALLLYRDGSIKLFRDGNVEQIAEEYYACGSGEDYALAALDAMHALGLPADPRIAVTVACRRDAKSREPIHTMRWKKI